MMWWWRVVEVQLSVDERAAVREMPVYEKFIVVAEGEGGLTLI